MNPIHIAIVSRLSRTQSAPSGWMSFSGPCCIHNGQGRPDTKGRGGLLISGETIVYNCFNCGFRAGYSPYSKFSNKFQRLLTWFGYDQKDLEQFRLIHLKAQNKIRTEEGLPEVSIDEAEDQNLNIIKVHPLPPYTKTLNEWASNHPPEEFNAILEYLSDRGDYLISEYGDLLRWSSERKNNLYQRVILPIIINKQIIGYSARTIDTRDQLRYLSDFEGNVLFNLDALHNFRRKICVVVEGPFDALAIDGVATMTNRISDEKNYWLENSNKRIIVVPDGDKSGHQMIEDAFAHGYEVSIPSWLGEYKDASSAAKHLGRLYTLHAIIESASKNRSRQEILFKKALKGIR